MDLLRENPYLRDCFVLDMDCFRFNGERPFEITHGMRIAQRIVANVVRAELSEEESPDRLDGTIRSDGGFGSTG